MLGGKHGIGAMAAKQKWTEFVQALRARQDELLAEARPFERG
jgi:hypothetical protein